MRRPTERDSRTAERSSWVSALHHRSHSSPPLPWRLLGGAGTGDMREGEELDPQLDGIASSSHSEAPLKIGGRPNAPEWPPSRRGGEGGSRATLDRVCQADPKNARRSCPERRVGRCRSRRLGG